MQPMQISLQRGPDDDGPSARHDQLLEGGVVTDRLRPILGARFVKKTMEGVGRQELNHGEFVAKMGI